MDRLGIEMLSVFGMPPIEFVQLVADQTGVAAPAQVTHQCGERQERATHAGPGWREPV